MKRDDEIPAKLYGPAWIKIVRRALDRERHTVSGYCMLRLAENLNKALIGIFINDGEISHENIFSHPAVNIFLAPETSGPPHELPFAQRLEEAATSCVIYKSHGQTATSAWIAFYSHDSRADSIRPECFRNFRTKNITGSVESGCENIIRRLNDIARLVNTTYLLYTSPELSSTDSALLIPHISWCMAFIAEVIGSEDTIILFSFTTA